MAKTYVRSKDVFINCPFDASYKPIFNAIVFAVCELGFRARCALEIDDAGDTRLDHRPKTASVRFGFEYPTEHP